MGTIFYVPPHPVIDPEKFDRLLESFRAGVEVPPVAVCGEAALTGSHRVEAHRVAYGAWSRAEAGWEDGPEPRLDAVEVPEDDYLAACQLLGVGHHDEVEHLDLFAAALHRVTGDDRLKSALDDQRGDYQDYGDDDFAWYARSR